MMNRMLTLFLALVMAGMLCVGCANGNGSDSSSRQPASSEPPATSEIPVVSTSPETPKTPAVPETPTVPETPAVPALTPEEAAILAQRRDAAEQYMRAMATVLWRAEEDITYALQSGKTPQDVSASDLFHIKAGRLYRGIPYSYAYSTLESFLTFTGEPSDNGIYSVSGLKWPAVNGGSGVSRVGNDCSGAVITAWGRIGAALPINSCKYMCESKGFLKVGDYQSDPSENMNTQYVTTETNGEQVMYRAYAQMQKADAVVTRKSTWGHARMVVSVDVVYNADGTINGAKSSAIMLEQTSSYVSAELKAYNKELGEDVYIIYGVDKKYSFKALCNDGYLPITCKELVDPSPVAESVVEDSVKEHSRDTILIGIISSNKLIDRVTIVICDQTGKEVQKVSLNATRTSPKAFDMQKFVNDVPEALRGSLDLQGLKPGNYRCITECSLATGEEFTVRDFEFII